MSKPGTWKLSFIYLQCVASFLWAPGILKIINAIRCDNASSRGAAC